MRARDATATWPTGPNGPSEIPKAAYRGQAAIALEGPVTWDLDRIITTAEGRWNRARQPTIYFAADPGVALAEFGRHAPKAGLPPVASLWTLQVSLDGVSDLRDAADQVLLHPARCRALADELRTLGVPGLVVPSVAFLDDRDRFNVVIFPDIIGALMSDVIQAPRHLATITPN